MEVGHRAAHLHSKPRLRKRKIFNYCQKIVKQVLPKLYGMPLTICCWIWLCRWRKLDRTANILLQWQMGSWSSNAALFCIRMWTKISSIGGICNRCRVLHSVAVKVWYSSDHLSMIYCESALDGTKDIRIVQQSLVAFLTQVWLCTQEAGPKVSSDSWRS